MLIGIPVVVSMEYNMIPIIKTSVRPGGCEALDTSGRTALHHVPWGRNEP